MSLLAEKRDTCYDSHVVMWEITVAMYERIIS